MGVVLFFIVLVLVVVVGVVVFRAAISVILISSGISEVRDNYKSIVTATAALINLVFINILKFAYNRIGEYGNMY